VTGNARDDQNPAASSVADGADGDRAGMLAHQRAWESFAGYAVRLIPVLKAQMAAVTDETERSVLELMVHLRAVASPSAVVSEAERAASLSKVVMAMQFQDITRQKLEHVGQALDHWRQHLQALQRGPNDEEAKQAIAALQQFEQHYTMEEERRLHAAALKPDYQEPVPVEMSETGQDSVILF
jgi:hypothetical protein